MARDAGTGTQREEQIESEWEAAPAVAVVIGGQFALALLSRQEHWQLVGLGWWIWLVPAIPELIVLVPLAWHLPRQRLEQRGLRRAASLSLIGLISVANGLLICTLVTSLLRGDERSGRQLLAKAVTVWGTNVVAFGLWYWAFDRGGPVRRRQPDHPPPRLPVSADGEPEARGARLAPAADRLHLRLVHELDRVQPDRRHAAQHPRRSS